MRQIIFIGLIIGMMLFTGCNENTIILKKLEVQQAEFGNDIIQVEQIPLRIVDNQWDPEYIEVKTGTKIQLDIVTDKNMVFAIEGYGLDEQIVRNHPATINFFADKPGSYEFGCELNCEYPKSGLLVVR